VAALQESAGGPVFEPARIELSAPSEAGQRAAVLWLPTFRPAFGAEAVKWLAAFVALVAGGRVNDADREAASRNLEKLRTRLRTLRPYGDNTALLLRAAHDCDIPSVLLPANVVQFGYGARGRLMRSTTTDRTSSLGARIAADKEATASLLRHAGFPVPDQRPARSLSEARAAARAIGYPVLIKARWLERGEGVAGDLSGEEELKRAYRRVSRKSRDLLVERHVPGATYRLNVVEGLLCRVAGKAATVVTGDGRRTVRALIEAENADPARAPGSPAMLKPIPLDDELADRLAVRGMSLDTVLPAGEPFVTRGTANTSNGARRLDVDVDSVHPETRRVCERVATLLGLDVAGIDVVTPDLGRPLDEVGGVICEVNAAPQIHARPAFYRWFLPRLLGPERDMDVSAWLADPADPAALPEALGPVDEDRLAAALLDRARHRLTLVTDGAQVAGQGVPTDRLHGLAVGPWHGAPEALAAALSVLCEQLRGPLVAAADHPHLGTIRSVVGDREVDTVPAPADLGPRLAEHLSARY
jgi:cyanophycin synthetase